ncbi:hypothetical protein N7513_012866 [Penicillium frequentans]|nr:hypothetical protein N7513_012866 [Penicillium glabrum]
MRFSGTGCHPCRQTRKKCDETKPVCQRCARNGKKCYGYRQAFSVIHDENRYASRHQKRPQGPRAIAESTASLMTLSLPRDLHSEAVAYFAHFHLEPTTNRPLITGAPTKALLSNWDSSPVLEIAASSTALALFANAKAYLPAAKLAFNSYQKSLVTLRSAISAPDCIDIDACILAVCMLVRYEDAVCASPQRGIPFLDTVSNRGHLNGIVALLEYWVKRPGGTKAPSEAIKYARRILRKAAIFGRIVLPAWLQDGALFGEQELMLQIDRILVRLISARRQLISFPQKPELSAAECILSLHAMEQEIMSIDGSLVACKALHTDVSRCTQHTLASNRVYSKDHFLLPSVYSHRSYARAALCAHYYGYRILTNHLRICILKQLETYSPGQPLTECKRTIDDMLEDLASITPFGLDRVKISEDCGVFGDHISINPNEDRRLYVAELMALPILIASTCDSVKMEYSNWFRFQLGDMGRLLGYRIMRVATSSYWPILSH